MLRGQVSTELEINVPPSKAWELYRGLQLGELCEAKIPAIHKVTVVEGDGGVGTVLQVTYAPGPGRTLIFKEKFISIDDENRFRETECIEGGYLNLGFTLFRVRFEVLTKEGDDNSCIVKSTIYYQVQEEFASNAALVSIGPFEELVKVAAEYLTAK